MHATDARTVATLRANTEVGDSGCWIWTAAVSRRGYAIWTSRFRGERKTWAVHRIMYQSLVGPIPDGLQLDHLCRNRACVNPDHLEPVTARENLMRSPVAPAALNAAKTHCPAGHAYDEANTYVNQGRRHCRICVEDRRKRWRAKNRATT